MKTLAVFAAVAAVVFSAAGATPGEGDVRFVRALGESDPERRGEALLTSAESGVYPAELALIHLTRAKLPPRSAARLLPLARSGGLVPTVLLLRAARQDEAKTPTRGELFDLAHAAWQKAGARELSPFQQRLFRELSGEVLQLAWERGETARLFPEVERRISARDRDGLRDFPLSALLEFFYRHAFVHEGFELYSEDWSEASAPGRNAFAAVLAEQSRHRPESDAEAAARIRLLLALGETDAAIVTAAGRMLADRNRENVYRMIFTAVRSGRREVFGTVRTLINDAEAPFLEAETCVCGGEYAEALKFLPKISRPASRAHLELKCRMGLGEFAAAAKLAGDPASPLDEHDRILALLQIAECTKDPNCYRTAERIAGKSIDADASLANSFGYVALVLGLDRDLAERRIRHALSVKPDESAFLDSLAWARHLAGDHAEAWKLMESALRRSYPDPEFCELLAHAGAIRLALGDRAGARRYCEQALKLAEKGAQIPATAVTFRRHVDELRKMLEHIK